MASRYCRVCGQKPGLTIHQQFHEMDNWPDACHGHFAHRSSSASLQIIKDIDPYQAVAGDVAIGGKIPKIGGRRQHREFLRRNKYIEVGNDSRPQRADYGAEVTEREVRQTYERLRDSR